MHELGVLTHIVKTVTRTAQAHNIRRVKHITLEVGEASGYVPHYLHKLFPVAADQLSLLEGAQLRLETVPGRGLVIKELGY